MATKKFYSASDAAEYAAGLTDEWKTEDAELLTKAALSAFMKLADKQNPLDEDNDDAYYVVGENGRIGITQDAEANIYWIVRPYVSRSADRPAPKPAAPKKTAAEAPKAAEAPVKQAKFCSGCGAPLKPGAKFCSKCGKVLNTAAAAAAKPAPRPATPKAAPAPKKTADSAPKPKPAAAKPAASKPKAAASTPAAKQPEKKKSDAAAQVTKAAVKVVKQLLEQTVDASSTPGEVKLMLNGTAGGKL